MSEDSNEASVQSVVVPREAIAIEKLVDTLAVKMEATKAEYLRTLDIYSVSRQQPSRLDYQNGVYDGLERAWREAVFALEEVRRNQQLA